MKRILMSVLALCLAITGTNAISAQQPAISNDASITPTSKVYAAWQPFEHGVMLWWSDLDQVWVLINPSGSTNLTNAYIYKDDWTNESAPNYGTPPDGRYSAIRGFGRVWGMMGGPGSQLGWALAPELGYDSASRAFSGAEVIIGGPGDTEYGVTFIPTAQAYVFQGIGVYRVIDIG